MFKKILLLLLICLTGLGQNQNGINYSNYSFSTASDINPANLGSSKLKIGFNIINAEAHIFNNYSKWNAPFSFVSFFSGGVPNKYRNSAGLIMWKSDYVKPKTNLETINGSVNVTIAGPAFMYNFYKIDLGIQAGMNIKAFAGFDGTSEEIGRQIVQGVPEGLFNTPVINNKANVSIGYYKEWYLTAGKTIYDDGYNRFKIGITGKYLTADSFFSINATQLDYQVYPDASNQNKSNTIINEAVGDIYLSKSSGSLNLDRFLSDLFYVEGNYGFAGNLGFTYEFRPNFIKYSRKYNGKWIENTDKVAYKYKIGVSILDFGKLNFNNAKVLTDFNSSVPVEIKNGELQENTLPSKLFTLLEDKFNFNSSKYTSYFNFYTPFRINLFIDYQVVENKFITAYVNQAINLNEEKGFKAISSLGIVPRYETKNLELSVSLLALNNFQNITIGNYVRFHGAYLGTNHFLGFFNFSKTKGASVFGGVNIPIYLKPKKLEMDCYYPSAFKKKNPFYNKVKRILR